MIIKGILHTAVGLALMAGAAQASFAISPELNSRSVIVSFENSDTYTDIRTRSVRSKKSEASVLESIEKTFRESSKKHLPAGYTLQVDVEDIDLAGDQSELTSRLGEYRVLSAVHPPRIAFRYTVIDQTERVVASGRANLSDLNYQNDLRQSWRNSGELAPYVNDLVSDWVSRDLRQALNAAS